MKDTWFARLHAILEKYNFLEGRKDIADEDLPLAIHNCIISGDEQPDDHENFFTDFTGLIDEAILNRYDLFDVNAYGEKLEVDRQKMIDDLSTLTGGLFEPSEGGEIVAMGFGGPDGDFEIDLSNKTTH